MTLPLAAVATGLLVAIAIRFGLLTALICRTCDYWLEYWVMTPDPSAWYFYVGAIAIGLVLALALWACTRRRCRPGGHWPPRNADLTPRDATDPMAEILRPAPLGFLL